MFLVQLRCQQNDEISARFGGGGHGWGRNGEGEGRKEGREGRKEGREEGEGLPLKIIVRPEAILFMTFLSCKSDRTTGLTLMIQVLARVRDEKNNHCDQTTNTKKQRERERERERERAAILLPPILTLIVLFITTDDRSLRHEGNCFS